MDFCSIASGSSGNCYFIREKETAILIDAGISARRIEKTLGEITPFKPAELSGIFITHEHTDHIQGLRVFARKFNLPIYATFGTWQGMADKLHDVPPELCRVIEDRGIFELDNMSLSWFPLSHDALQPVGYTVEGGGKKLGLATDTGVLPEVSKTFLKNCDFLVMESNYDENMLKKGSYPSYLKARILSKEGHLSNIDAGEALLGLLNSRTKRVALAHLSGDNNCPYLALKTVKNILAKKEWDDKIILETVPRGMCGKYFSI